MTHAKLSLCLKSDGRVQHPRSLRSLHIDVHIERGLFLHRDPRSLHVPIQVQATRLEPCLPH